MDYQLYIVIIKLKEKFTSATFTPNCAGLFNSTSLLKTVKYNTILQTLHIVEKFPSPKSKLISLIL